MSALDEDHQAVAAVVGDYHRGWLENDAERLKSLWKEDAGDLRYVALEIAEPLRDLNTIKRYYDRAQAECNPPNMTIGGLFTEIVGDVAITFFDFHYEFSFRVQPPVPGIRANEHISADGRVTMALRRTDSGWKLMHYHESRRGPRLDPP